MKKYIFLRKRPKTYYLDNYSVLLDQNKNRFLENNTLKF